MGMSKLLGGAAWCHFPADIAVRIIGVTTGVDWIEGQYLPAQREDEILEWLARNEGGPCSGSLG